MADTPPKLFVSYSHDDELHKEWVYQLSTRLVANGVDVILDRWNLNLGGDLPRFIETGLVGANRVLAVCTENYVNKANAGEGGVGYEKLILTAQLMEDLSSDRIIPLLRNNGATPLLPTFLSGRVYTDFRADSGFEEKYEELIREIHGNKSRPRPPLGKNPFDEPVPIPHQISMRSERYVSPALEGTVTFDYSNNNGSYVIGAGDVLFETKWSDADRKSIYAYADFSSIRSIALAEGVSSIEEIVDAGAYDNSSRVRTPHLGEIVVWANVAGYFAATRIESLKSRSHGDEKDEIKFTYTIQSNRRACFATGM